MECFLSTLINRLKDVTCATEPNEHDMLRLRDALPKAIGCEASTELVAVADSLYQRLDAELGKYVRYAAVQ